MLEIRNRRDIYESTLDAAQQLITHLVDQILISEDFEQTNHLTHFLLRAAKEHFIIKRRCLHFTGIEFCACTKRVDIEELGLTLIEETLRKDHTDKFIKRLVRSWFRDNFWMIEAECLKCLASEQSERREEIK